MKKFIVAVLIVFILSLSGCSFLPSVIMDSNNIETLNGWSFQSNPETNDYSIFFGLLDNNDKYIAADVDIDIRIVNDEGEKVYSATKSVTSKDFGDYESKASGKQYLANVRIPASDIKAGKSSNGIVYLTVYKGEAFHFDEVNCTAQYCLPVADVNLSAEGLPVKIKVKGYDGSTESVLKITDVSYAYEKEYPPQLKITFSGQKIDGNSSSYDIISYKLYDSNRYLIDSNNVYLDSLNTGDKFKDDSIVVYDITPGENYTLQFTEYN